MRKTLLGEIKINCAVGADGFNTDYAIGEYAVTTKKLSYNNGEEILVTLEIFGKEIPLAEMERVIADMRYLKKQLDSDEE